MAEYDYTAQQLRDVIDSFSVEAVKVWLNNRIVDLHMELEEGVDEEKYKEYVGRMQELRALTKLPDSLRNELSGKLRQKRG